MSFVLDADVPLPSLDSKKEDDELTVLSSNSSTSSIQLLLEMLQHHCRPLITSLPSLPGIDHQPRRRRLDRQLAHLDSVNGGSETRLLVVVGPGVKEGGRKGEEHKKSRVSRARREKREEARSKGTHTGE